jgi:hypothetical protein
MTGIKYPFPRVSPQGCIEGRSVQIVQFPDESGVRSNVLNDWSHLNFWNGGYLLIAGTVGVAVACSEFSGSSR